MGNGEEREDQFPLALARKKDVYKLIYKKLFEWHFDIFGLIGKG